MSPGDLFRDPSGHLDRYILRKERRRNQSAPTDVNVGYKYNIVTVYAATVRLAGDSTMANTGANDGYTAGWGQYIGNYLNIPIDYAAIGGRSSRSYTREGRFTALANKVVSGDYVIIEFGHNDGGGLSTDNGHRVCGVGTAGYATTCQTTNNGVSETVQTYYTYLVAAAKLFKSKGANVIISSSTPNNVCETGTCSYSAGRFTGYARCRSRRWLGVRRSRPDHSELVHPERPRRNELLLPQGPHAYVSSGCGRRCASVHYWGRR